MFVGEVQDTMVTINDNFDGYRWNEQYKLWIENSAQVLQVEIGPVCNEPIELKEYH